jgi:hypothetical protein
MTDRTSAGSLGYAKAANKHLSSKVSDPIQWLALDKPGPFPFKLGTIRLLATSILTRHKAQKSALQFKN